MSDVMKTLGLTQLEKALPVLFEQARQQKMTYETFLQRALDAEVEGRNLRAAQRRIQAARLPVTKTLESFDFSFQPSISERLVRELADLSFVQTTTNVIFLGPPGVGKTHLCIALAVKALAAGHSKAHNPAQWEDGTYSVEGAAARLGVFPGTIHTWLKGGKLTGYQLAKGMPWKVYVTEEDMIRLQEWLRRARRLRREAL